MEPKFYFWITLFIFFTPQYTNSQFPGVANTIFGPNSLLRGVKSVIGGIVKLDSVHSKCMQKTMCSEFADEIIDNCVELDPVKRTWVYKPKIIQRKGRLRWIGDMVSQGVSKISRTLGLYKSNRRQSPTLLGSVASFALENFGKIPLQSIVQ